MTRLERYVLSVFIPALLLFGAGLTGLMIVMDYVVRWEEFQRLSVDSPTLFTAKFYLFRLPLLVRMTLPAIPLFAAAFTVVRLARTNEVIPMVASGANLRRIFLPFLVAGGICSVLLMVLDQWVLPPLIPEIAEAEELMVSKGKTNAVIVSDEMGNYLFTPLYSHPDREMRGNGRRGILLLQTGPDGRRRMLVRCERAVWDEKGEVWIFRDGVVQGYADDVRPLDGGPDPAGRPTFKDQPIPPEGLPVACGVRPGTMRRGAEMVKKFVPFGQARQAAADHPEIPELKTRLMDKVTYPLSPLLILLLGLPFVTGLGQKSQIVSGLMSLAACIVYFGLYLIGQDLVNQQTVGAALGGWGPTVLFGCLGAGLYGAIQT